MLRKRVIPIVLLDGFSVLKTINFNKRRNLGSPITVVRTYNTRNVDELIILDIDASKDGRAIDKFTIQELALECFMPLTVGGGIRSINDIKVLLEKGADKIAINTYALENPSFINEAATIFGSQCIVVSIDVVECNNNYYIFNNGKTINDIDLFDWISKVENLGAGEILINNVSRDGKMEGANVELAQKISQLVSIPVIYAGGVSSPGNAALVGNTSASAVAISSIFHFTNSTPEDCRLAFKKLNIPVR
jgi:cyclase